MHYSAVQYCPDCESLLTKLDGHKPLPVAFRLCLRITLPWSEDDHPILASRDQEDTDQQKLAKQISAVDGRLENLNGRLENLEGRFDMVANDTQCVKTEMQNLKDKMQNLEDKMERILSVLSGLAASPLLAAAFPSQDIIAATEPVER